MGVQERKLREKEGLRQEILNAASDLFVSQGYAAVSMRKIAERIEYSPTTIYLYFRDKSDLLDRICEDTFSQLIHTLESTDHRSLAPVDALRRGLQAYIDFGLAHPNHYRLTFLLEPGDVEGGMSGSIDMGNRAFDFLRQAVAACVESGDLKHTDIDLMSQSLWAGIHGVTSLLIVNPHFPWVDHDRLIDHLLDTLIDGLRKPKSHVGTMREPKKHA